MSSTLSGRTMAVEDAAAETESAVKSILVATDGSAPARRAMDVACELALRFGAEVNVIHVLDPESRKAAGARAFARAENLAKAVPAEPEDSMRRHTRLPPEIYLREQEEADDPYRIMAEIGERVLMEAATTAREHGVEHIHTFAESGRPADSIVALAERTQSDMIVIGSRGLSGLQGLLMGSVSRRVVERAPCTCVTVK